MRVKTARAKKQISRIIKRVPIAEVDDLFQELEETVEQRTNTETLDNRPGKIIDGKKTIFTYQDLCNMFDIVSFTPERTVPLTFNGVKVQAYAGIEMHVPQCFKEIYDQSGRELRNAGKRLAENRGYTDTIALGAGALEPER